MEKSRFKKIKKGDGVAFDQLCLDVYPNLISYAKMFLPEDWAQDIVQNVFSLVWENRAQIDENRSIKSYMFRAVHNRALNFIKSQSHSESFRQWNKNKILGLCLETANYESNPVIHNLYNSELRSRLNKAISSLPERQQEIFRLSYIEEFTNQEIADKLGLSVRTVGSHMYQALKNLRENLSSDDFCILLILGFYNIF